MAKSVEKEMLREIPMVANLPSWQFDAIAEFVEPLNVKKGAKLVECGTDDGFTYFLTSGKVASEDPSGLQMIIDAETDPVGTPIGNLRPRIADVQALKRVKAIRIPDLLLHPAASPSVSAETEGETQQMRNETETRLVLALYRDLKNNESSVLPSLPNTAVRIQLAIEDELSGADAVARLAVTDPAIAAKLIMIANSAMYGRLAPVESCIAAVVRLGMETTRQLVLTFALKEVFRTRDKALRQRMKDLWDHSVQVAATCCVLARSVPGLNPDEALLAGLVHDIGTIAVINYSTQYPQLSSEPAELEQTISRLRGELSALILRNWHFEPVAVLAARDAEFWLREHDGPADVTDLIIVAQVHEQLRRNAALLPAKIEDIPAITKVLGEAASPQVSIEILQRSQVLVDEIRSVLRR